MDKPKVSNSKAIAIERSWFIDSKVGNIKDDYYFEKKLGSGGYGAVYLAKSKKSGKFHLFLTHSRLESCCKSHAERKDSRL